MPKSFWCAALLVVLGQGIAAPRSYGQAGPKPGGNPILRDVFTADPAPLVY